MQKTPKDSESIMTEMVLPNDTNPLNNLMGGRMLHWIDIIGAIAAQKHSNKNVVTLSVDNVSFKEPIRLGHIVTLKAKVTRAFNTSMEVYIEVFSDDIPNGITKKTHDAFYTYVAIDDTGKPTPVPKLQPETEAEKALFEGAARRRDFRLLLSGRIKPEDAGDLKSFFKK